MTNKYLEKVAGILPRYVTRAMQNPGEMLKDLRSVGARAAKATRAAEFSKATKAGLDKVDQSIKARGSKMSNSEKMKDVTLGNLHVLKHKMGPAVASSARRAERTQKAADLGRKSAIANVKRMAVGASITGTAGAVAATKKKDK